MIIHGLTSPAGLVAKDFFKFGDVNQALIEMEEHYSRSKSKGIGFVTSKVSHRFVEAGDNVMESSVQVSKYSKCKINKGMI